MESNNENLFINRDYSKFISGEKSEKLIVTIENIETFLDTLNPVKDHTKPDAEIRTIEALIDDIIGIKDKMNTYDIIIGTGFAMFLIGLTLLILGLSFNILFILTGDYEKINNILSEAEIQQRISLGFSVSIYGGLLLIAIGAILIFYFRNKQTVSMKSEEESYAWVHIQDVLHRD